jgi:hypothetical protein
MEVEKKMRTFPDFPEYEFDDNTINNLKKKGGIIVEYEERLLSEDEERELSEDNKKRIKEERRKEKEKERTVEQLKSQLGNDANHLDSDLKWTKDSELVGVRDKKLTELVFYSYEKKIFFQIEPDLRRLFGGNMYTYVRPYVDNDGNPQIVKTSNGLDVYNFGWNVTEGFNQDTLDQKKKLCEDICTMKKCKDTHKLVSIEDVKKNIEQNNPNSKLVDSNGKYLIREATTRSPPPRYPGRGGGRRTIKKNKKKKSTRRKTKRIIIKKKKSNKRKN